MKIFITCIIVALAHLTMVDAYNFRSKKSAKVQNQQVYQSQKPVNRSYNSVTPSSTNRPTYQANNYNESRNMAPAMQAQSGFGFEQFNAPPIQRSEPQAKQVHSRSRNMSRGPQRRVPTRSNQNRVAPKKKITKVAAMPQQQTPPKLQGYKGEYYGGGNALFQVDPGLIGRWNKPGLSIKNKFQK